MTLQMSTIPVMKQLVSKGEGLRYSKPRWLPSQANKTPEQQNRCCGGYTKSKHVD